MKGIHTKGGMTMLVVTLTFHIIVSGIHSLPMYPSYSVSGYGVDVDPYYGSSYSPMDPYDPYSTYSPYARAKSGDPYPQVVIYDPYSSLNAYPIPQPQPYPAVSPYDPYASLIPYQIQQPQPYSSVNPYSPLNAYSIPQPQPYPSVNPYGPYSSSNAYSIPQPQPYPSVNPYDPYSPLNAYASPQPQPYPAVDPYDPYSSLNAYANPQPQPYPAVDPYDSYASLNAYANPQPQPLPAVDPYDLYASLSTYQTPQPQSSPSVDPYAPPQQPNGYPATPPPYSTSLGLYSPSVPQNYPVAPTEQQVPYSNVIVQQYGNPSATDPYYRAITNHVVDYRKHCGVVPATNDDIYSSSVPGYVNDVLPYGSFPWLAVIVDLDTNSVACLASVIHSEFVLTATSCITKPAGRYTVVKDWDILTKYNEYEPYKSYADPVCTSWPLSVDNSTGQSMYVLGKYNSELTVLVGPLEEHHSQYPADGTLCLPSDSSVLPSPYGNVPQPIQPMYSPYPQISYSQSSIPTGECWVAGYRSSPMAILQNHPQSVQVNSNQQQPPAAVQGYYNALDNSKVPRKALVRQVQCPAQAVQYPSPGSDDVCFVGINGYDACVADVGTAIFCVIDDYSQYDSGFSNDPTSDHGTVAQGATSGNPSPAQQIPQQQPIQLQKSQQKPSRRRAILYAVVKTPTSSCMAPSPPGSPPNVQQQSNHVVGIRVNPSIRASLQDLFWQVGYDLSCPTEKVGDVFPSPPAPVAPSYQPTSLQPQLYDPSLAMPSLYPQPNPLYPQPSPSPPPYQQTI